MAFVLWPQATCYLLTDEGGEQDFCDQGQFIGGPRIGQSMCAFLLWVNPCL